MRHLDPRIAPVEEAAARYNGYTADLSRMEKYHYKQGVQDALEFAINLLRNTRLTETDVRQCFAEFERVTGLDGGTPQVDVSLPPRPKMDGVE